MCNLQVKKLTKVCTSIKAPLKYPFKVAFDLQLEFNYFEYPRLSWKLFRLIFTNSDFFGLGQHSYYTLEISKKHWLSTKNYYLTKLNIKKDSWFFYGLVVSWKINFLSSTITLWNVFYNEIMEKTFPIFSSRNTLVGRLKVGTFKHFLSNFLWNWKYKKKLWSVWNYPRATCRITLV